MNGYIAQRRGRFYAVIYEGLDPVTGKERRIYGIPPVPIGLRPNGSRRDWRPRSKAALTRCGR
ncbi:MAG: hypothetical protein LC749_17810 [Actinobacteria bacterium]|nr:hypothetical protein [Actinomycetota bacterium]